MALPVLPIVAGLAGLYYVATRKPKVRGGVWLVGFHAPAAFPDNEFVYRNIALEMGWEWDKVTNMALNYSDGVNYVTVRFAADYAAGMPKVNGTFTIAGIYSRVSVVQRQPTA